MYPSHSFSNLQYYTQLKESVSILTLLTFGIKSSLLGRLYWGCKMFSKIPRYNSLDAIRNLSSPVVKTNTTFSKLWQTKLSTHVGKCPWSAEFLPCTSPPPTRKLPNKRIKHLLRPIYARLWASVCEVMLFVCFLYTVLFLMKQCKVTSFWVEFQKQPFS